MIGVVGPPDSVELVTKMAEEMGLEASLLTRSYKVPEDAAALAEELEPLCTVLLFTGRVPFVMAAAAGSRAVRTFYIPHEGTDLYRAIASLLLSSACIGELPRLSFDSMEAAQICEAFGELGLEPPRHIIALHSESRHVINVSRIVAHHRLLFESGEVDLCMTCIGEVHRRLAAHGVKSLRIAHSRIVVREALTRARLSMDLARAEAAQVAACVLQARSPGRSSPRTVSRRMLQAVGRKYAEALDGRVVKHSPSEFVFLTTRATLERSLQSEFISRASQMNTELREYVKIGIGFGASASLAESHARRALEATVDKHQHVALALDDGSTIPLRLIGPINTRTVRSQNLRMSRRLDISPTLVSRLGEVFRELDPSSFTANELASSYGVLPRSARRLIALLRKQGLVEECGIEKGVGAGRPQVAYRIALARMISSD